MKLYFNDKELSVQELQEVLNNLKTCENDGGDFELLELEEIDSEGNFHFGIAGCSTY